MGYKRIVHYSKCKRENGHWGGVEKFGWYLQKAIGCEVLTPEDKPSLNDRDTLYIVDNHFGLHIGDGCRVICMLHGCAGERGFNNHIGNLQKQMVGRPNTYYVANSLETSTLCKQYYKSHVDEIIHLAVDQDLYYPRSHNSDKVILTATDNKGHKGNTATINQVNVLLPKDYRIINIRCGVGEEHNTFKQAGMFMLLSTHEGFAYSVLEAMCSNAKVLTGKHGIAYELQHTGIIETINDGDMNDAKFIVSKLIDMSNKECTSRSWVLNSCSLKMFNDKWQNIIKKEQLI